MNCNANGSKAGFFERHVFNPLNFTAAMSLSAASTETVPATGSASGTPPSGISNVDIPASAGKLAAISAKYEVLNHFDPRSSAFQAAWKNQINTSLSASVGGVVVRSTRRIRSCLPILLSKLLPPVILFRIPC